MKRNATMSENPIREFELLTTRRQLFGKAALGLGTAAMASLWQPQQVARRHGEAELELEL